MCGIAGIVNLRGKAPVDKPCLSAMASAILHRGPDEGGFHLGPGVGLASRRLAIVDLAGGSQPIYNEDRSVCIVYNGELYNFQPLARELMGRGHKFRTHSDTEVVVHAWEEWGEACVERFNGMFAFAIWDERQQTLFLARDRLGEKPLYYSHVADGSIVFGSEIKSLLCHSGIVKEIDVRAVEDYFAFGYVPDPKSIYRDVRKLPPGHTLMLKRGRPPSEPRCYWDVKFETGDAARPREIEETLIERLREAVKIRLISEVPLGAFLSGGVDSSSVVAMMAGLKQDPVETFSISFGAPEFDESSYAAGIAERYHTAHHVRRVDPNSFDLLDRLATIYDEPFGDSSAIPTFRVSALARERVTVALSGDGGDEIFAGYRRYRWHVFEEHVRRLLPQSLRGPVFGALGRVYPKLDWAPRVLRAKSTLQGLARSTLSAYFSSVSVCGDALRQRLFSPSMLRALDGYRAAEVLEHHFAKCGTVDPLAQVQYLDLKTYLPGDILTKVDRASMANSLEVRVPLLDHTFVEWAARLPSALKLRGREGKFVFKKALEPYVPAETLYRPKQGFAVPLAQWFRGPLKDRLRATVTGPVLRESGFFDMEFVRRLVDQHQAGVRDFSAPLWTLSLFEAFLRQVHARDATTRTVQPAVAAGG